MSEKELHFKNMCDELFHYRDNDLFKNDTEKGLKLTKEILLLNPMLYTAWNVRKNVLQILENELKEDAIEHDKLFDYELKLTSGGLNINAKLYAVWYHREWCIKKLYNPDFEEELKLTQFLLNKDSRNFHAWNYRREICNLIEKKTGSKDIWKKEFDLSYKMIEMNISNFSVYHNRVNFLFKKEKYCFEDIEQELRLCHNAIVCDPSDYSIFGYYSFLLSKLVELMNVNEFVFFEVDEDFSIHNDVAEVEDDEAWTKFEMYETNSTKQNKKKCLAMFPLVADKEKDISVIQKQIYKEFCLLFAFIEGIDVDVKQSKLLKLEVLKLAKLVFPNKMKKVPVFLEFFSDLCLLDPFLKPYYETLLQD
eukprot:TRINITY_DN3202_c1_g2_i1.p1 TRINITY_DN3202_c1_g2~~TRINITY_DN3202_c1_g2_i1.p1  ORF type:complete len:373 (-),score=100.76 TRINITY_DN3202_c1_g2_i1:14-1105(-)